MAQTQTVNNLNLKNQPLLGEISGYKWNDLNGNGTRDADESGLADWTIYLDDNKNGQLDDGEISTVTDATGKYTFSNLLSGTYTVAEVLKPNWVQTASTVLSSEITQVTNNNSDDSYARISGNNVVWSGFSGNRYNSSSKIYYYDGSSITQLTNNPSYDYQISGDNVVWSEYNPQNSDNFNTEIYYYNGNTITQLTNNNSSEYYPAIDGNNVVWSGSESNYSSLDIYYYNGSTITQLTDTTISQQNPQISGNNVVWAGYNVSDLEIYFYNGSTITQLTNNTINDLSPQISGNNVIWKASQSYYPNYGSYEISQIYYYDGSNIIKLADNISTSNPQISGNNAVWSASKIVGYYDEFNGPPEFVGTPIYASSEIYYYDGTKVIQLTGNDSDNPSFSNTNPKIDGKNIVWVGFDGNDNEIYYYNGIDITKLTNNNFDDSDPAISGTNITWSGYDGTDYEIFTFNFSNYNINLDPGEVVSDINFGNWQVNTISGSKWHDLDGDGTFDEGESALAGWTIYLDANSNGQLDEGETYTITDRSGNYSFTVGEGTYNIAEVIQTGWVQTSPSEGSYTVSVAGGVNLSGYDFGNQALAGSISGTKWNDKNANGIRDEGEPGLADWTIYLDSNQNSQLDEGEVSTVTDDQGNYSFNNLLYGTYTVLEVNQSGWIQTAGATTLELKPDQNITDINFGNWNPVTISGNKWEDTDGDGIRDEGEAGLLGWKIYLDTNNNGELDWGETSTVTDGEGNYSFSVIEGTYTVSEVSVSGWEQTLPTQGSYTVSLSEGQTANNLDFGNQPLPGEISGYKWNDLDANGTWDADESGLANWTIYLDDNKNGQLDEGETSTVTDATGKYTFSNLSYGIYTVAEVLKPNWVQTATDFGSKITQLTNNNLSDFYPQISGNNVVWSGWDWSIDPYDDSEIYYYDGSRIIQLTDNNYGDGEPQISGDNIVWSEYDGNDSEIYYYNGSTITQLTDNNTNDYSPQIDSNHIVWLGNDGNDNEIYYYDGNTITQLTNNKYNEFSPKISGNNVVWEGFRAGSLYNTEIYYYNGNTISQLTNNSISERDSEISGNNIVWRTIGLSGDYYYENSKIYYYNGSNVIQLSDDNLDAYSSPQISGNQVVWSAREFLGFDESGDPYFSDSEIYYYNGTNVIQLTDNDFGGYDPKISGNNIVWSGWDGNDSEIYYSDGNIITQLTDNDFDDISPDISGTNITWSGYSERGDSEIFTLNLSANTITLDPGEVVNNINFGNHYLGIEGTSGNDKLTGTSNADIIDGLAGKDTINGNNGDDTLDGGTGSDRLLGGLGNDVYIVDSSRDVVVEKGGEGEDLVQSSVSFTLTANVENLTLTGTANINGTGNKLDNIITGNSGNNLLKGLAGNDRLIAGGGNDTLVGGAGNDTLTGGEGSDQFLFGNGWTFATNSLGVDTLTDFTKGTDHIVLSTLSWTNLSSAVGNYLQASELAIINVSAENEISNSSTLSAKIIYNQSTGNLLYNQNGNREGLGNGGLFATLTGTPQLDNSDFIIST